MAASDLWPVIYRERAALATDLENLTDAVAVCWVVGL